MRLPITEPVLHKLVTSLNLICPDRYDQLLYRSIFCLAFYGLARIGELVLTNQRGVTNVLQIDDLHIRYHNENPSSSEIKSSKFKHNTDNTVHTVTVAGLDKDSVICPVKALLFAGPVMAVFTWTNKTTL